VDESVGERAPGQTLVALTWPEVHELAGAGAVLAVPLGSTEQHGPHLPLSTDTDVAVALCNRLARARADVLVAPAVPYGASGEHKGFAGTLSLGSVVLEQVVLELGRSAFETFDRVVFVSGHGGNAEAATRAVRQLRLESRDARLYQPRYAGDPHAGRAETSMQLALHPDAVQLDRAEPGDTRSLRELMPLLLAGGLRAVTANGILGDPTGANAPEGEALLAALAVALVGEVAAWYPLAVSAP
jgi:mycofactocin system creatininase family protein